MRRGWLCRLLVGLVWLGCVGAVHANDAPPSTLNTVSLTWSMGKHLFEYLHWRVIGVCVWTHHSLTDPVTITPELDEYLPDLVVTVFNEAGDDTWTLARTTLDTTAHTLGNTAVKQATGDELTDGRNTPTPGVQSNASVITKSVDVIGSPLSALHLPFINLRPDTTPLLPYYQSALDALPSRLGLAELVRVPEALNLTRYFIGPDYWHHWAYEFPRTQSVDNNNDFMYPSYFSMMLMLRSL